MQEESGRVVIEPTRTREYRLGDLLKQITPENSHEEVDFGRPQGKETW